MSHQSPPASQQSPQQYGPSSTYPSSIAPPPAKRQRLSPDARSPAPTYTNGSYGGNAQPQVTSSYGNPYAPSQPMQQQPSYPQYAGSPIQDYSQASFNTPQPYQGRQTWQQPQQQQAPKQAQSQQQSQQRAGNAASPPGREMMPPPPRPNREEGNEKFGVDDVNDALFSSGINLKDEENYIHNTFANRHSGTESFSSNPNASFGSSSNSQGGSFNLLTQTTSFSSQPNEAGAGSLGAAVSQENVDDELKQLRLQAARRKADSDQHHLKNPFLLGNVLRLRMESIAKLHGVRLDVAGMYVLMPQAKTMMTNGKTEGVVEAKDLAGSVIDAGVPFADTLSLISLAAAERVRGLLDEAHALARARRYADYGRVPVDFSDVAIGEGTPITEKVLPESITETPWDQPSEGSADQLVDTIGFQSRINQHFRTLAKHAEEAEQARLKRRAARRKAAEAASNNEEDSTMINGDDTADTTALGDAAAGTPQAKLTKKEMVRQQKEKASLSEAQAATTTNQTAAMMALGKKGKRYSWMSGGAASMPTNRFAKSSAPGTPLPGSDTPGKQDGARTPLTGKNPDADAAKSAGISWGDWRENGHAGKRIQERDWLLVLERDGREKRAVERAQSRLGTPFESKVTSAPPISQVQTPVTPAAAQPSLPTPQPAATPA